MLSPLELGSWVRLEIRIQGVRGGRDGKFLIARYRGLDLKALYTRTQAGYTGEAVSELLPYRCLEEFAAGARGLKKGRHWLDHAEPVALGPLRELVEHAGEGCIERGAVLDQSHRGDWLAELEIEPATASAPHQG